MYTPMADLCYAFGVSERKVTYCVTKYYQNNQSLERKTHLDREQTIFNSEKKRKVVLTAKTFYKRCQRKRHNEPISEGQLAGAYSQLSDDVPRQCKQRAAGLRDVVTNIHHEIKDVTKKKKIS